MPFLSEIYTFSLWLNAISVRDFSFTLWLYDISVRDFYLWFVAPEFFISGLIFTKNPVMYYFDMRKLDQKLLPVSHAALHPKGSVLANFLDLTRRTVSKDHPCC
jgi:hypothetical protein